MFKIELKVTKTKRLFIEQNEQTTQTTYKMMNNNENQNIVQNKRFNFEYELTVFKKKRKKNYLYGYMYIYMYYNPPRGTSAKQRMDNYAFVTLFLWQFKTNNIHKHRGEHEKKHNTKPQPYNNKSMYDTHSLRYIILHTHSQMFTFYTQHLMHTHAHTVWERDGDRTANTVGWPQTICAHAQSPRQQRRCNKHTLIL